MADVSGAALRLHCQLEILIKPRSDDVERGEREREGAGARKPREIAIISVRFMDVSCCNRRVNWRMAQLAYGKAQGGHTLPRGYQWFVEEATVKEVCSHRAHVRGE
ncbi:unnamed protein product [Pleuronectes platessa]|uniref:Uncharacterized protein n=1 Tax=Pleuronectes platessa TaxID=8262 RepID=A0A9N7YTK2_PLEPL|nr:unnamed protein product [Pleuronectes platessa]